MKKLIAIIIALLFISTNTCFAFSELYYIKNVNESRISPIVEGVFANQGYTVLRHNPYYAKASDNNDYAVIILQQSGNDLFYYFNSEKNSKINKNIIKQLKSSYIEYEQSINANAINIYDSLAKDIIASNGSTKNYIFEEEQVFQKPQEVQVKNNNQTALQGYIAQIPEGTKFVAYLQNAINTSSAEKGDNVTAVLTDNLTYNGVVIAPQGSLVNGTLSKANHAQYGSRNGRVVIRFNQIVTPENKVFNITAEDIDFSVTNEGKLAESAKSAVTGAALGALAGLLCALIGDGNVGRSVAIGAGIGAGSSAVISTVERGVDAEIPSFTELEITLTKPLSVSVSY